MKNIILTCFRSFAIVPCVIGFLSGTLVKAQNDEAESFLKSEMNELHIPGMQVAVVKQGKIVFLKSYGIANIQDSVPVKNKSIFAINSCTKAFTGVAIMQLVEDGKIDLSAPVSRYLDGLPVAWQPITIKQLLTHISGLPDVIRVMEKGPEQMNEETIWEKVKALPMEFPTGEQYSYNQTNYALLGKIIDKLSGKPFAQVFKERQFQIAGMQNTMFGDANDVIPHFAPTYNYRENIDGQGPGKTMFTNNNAIFPPFRRTASGLNSTAEDMAKWIIALTHGKLFHSQASLNTLWTAGTYNSGLSTQWALGWGFTKFRPKHRAVGMTGGGRSAFLVYPEDDLAIVILTNLGGSFPENFIEEFAGYFDRDIPASDPITRLRIQLRKSGFENTNKVYEQLKKQDNNFKPDETEMNDWAYRLMSAGHNREALEIFKLNVLLYPNSWNVYDSYGESLLKNGQKEEAIKMYQKSVDINPGNQGGKKVLERISK